MVALIPSSAYAACTNVCYVDDDGTGDYTIDHSDDAIEINRAIAAVAANSTRENPGIVVLNNTTTPYMILNSIHFVRGGDNVTLKGENPNVKLQTAVGEMNITTILVSANYTGIVNFTIDGGMSDNGWCGGCGIKREVMFEYGILPSAHDIYVENVMVLDSPDDGFWGQGKNVTLKNVGCNGIGHSCVLAYYADYTYDINGDNDNWTIDGLYCTNTGNACFRDMSLNGLTLKNMYAYRDANYGIEIAPSDSTYYWSRNMYFENITIIAPPLAGIMMYANLGSNEWHIWNISFKNVLIDCTGEMNCQSYNGSNNFGSAVYGTNSTNVTFDHMTIVNASNNGFNFTNEHSIAANITIKNSIVTNSSHYAIKNNGGNFAWNIHHNDFWNNELGDTNGSVKIGSNMLYQNPHFISASDFHLQNTSPVIGMAENRADMGMYFIPSYPERLFHILVWYFIPIIIIVILSRILLKESIRKTLCKICDHIWQRKGNI